MSRVIDWFADQPMTKKITVGQWVTLGIFLPGVLIGLLMMFRVEAAVERSARAADAIIDLRTAHAELMDMNGLVRGIIIQPNEFLVKVYDDTEVRADAALARFVKGVEPGTDMARRGAQLLREVDALKREVLEPQLAKAMSGDPAQLEAALAYERSGDSFPYLERTLFEMPNIIDGQQAFRDQLRDDVALFLSIEKLVLVFGFLAAVVGGLFIGRRSGRLIGEPVAGITDAMERLASGEKGVDIPFAERKDEIGQMAKSVTVFRDAMAEASRLAAEQAEAEREAADLRAEQQEQERQRLAGEAADAERRTAIAAKLETLVSQFELRLRDVIGQLDQASGAMRTSSESLVSSAEVQLDRVENVDQIAARMEKEASDTAAVVEEFTASMREMVRGVSEANDLSQQAAEASEKGARIVEEMASASGEIETVVGLISDIAEQTNLLALNATIEAARAGDAGRGFAVVAGEVKALAAQTAQATGEIGTHVGQMQSVSKSAKEAISDAHGRMKHLDEVLDHVVGTIREQETAVGQVSEATAFTQQGSANVSEGLNTIADASQQAYQASDAVRDGSRELADTAEALRAEAAKFASDFDHIQAQAKGQSADKDWRVAAE